MKCEFTRVQLLLLSIGVTTISIGCEAFVGTARSNRRFALLSSTSESQDPILLEGKLHVLEDVVKELDARHKNLLEQSTVAQQEYDQKLQEIVESLNESEKTKGEQESAIAALEKEIADHVLDRASLEQQKDKERETKTKQLLDQNEESLEELKASFEKDVQALEEKLESKTLEAKGLSEQLETALASTAGAETDALIQELKEQIEAQQKQLDAATSESSKSISEATDDNSSALEELKAQHQKVVDDYENKIDELMTEDSQALSEMTAQHQTVVDDLEAKLNSLQKEHEKSLIELKALHLQDVEDYESRLDSIFADKEEVSNTLKADYDMIVEDYERKLQLAQAETDQLSSDLKAMEIKSEEQVAIATAAVEASEAREASLRQESALLTRTVQMYWIAAKLANILFDQTEGELSVVTQQQHELQAENEELHQELHKTKKGVQDLIEQLENQSNMWQKLRSKVSGKR